MILISGLYVISWSKLLFLYSEWLKRIHGYIKRNSLMSILTSSDHAHNCQIYRFNITPLYVFPSCNSITTLIKITANLWNNCIKSDFNWFWYVLWVRDWAKFILRGQRLLTLKHCSKYVVFGIKWKEIEFQTYKVTFIYPINTYAL